MSRFGVICCATGLAVVLFAALSDSTAQAPPGQDGAPGGGRGPGGFRGGPGGFGGGPGGGNSAFALVSNPEVQTELKLTEKQKGQLKTVSTAMDEKRRALFQGMRDNTGGGPPNPDMMRENFTAMQTESDAAVAKILDRSQRDRVKQIQLQTEGPLAVTKPEIAEKINLSPEQLDAIETIKTQMDEAQSQLRSTSREMFANAPRIGGPGADREAMKAKMNDPAVKAQFEKMRQGFDQMRQNSDKVRQQAILQIGKVLRKKQKDAFNRLLGEPFDLTKLDRRGGGRPPGAGADPKAKTDSAKADPPKPKAESTATVEPSPDRKPRKKTLREMRHSDP